MLAVPRAIQAPTRTAGRLEPLAGRGQQPVEGVHAGDHRAGLDPPDHGLGHPGPGRQFPLG